MARILPVSPAALAVPVKRTVVKAVQTRRIGNLSADRGLDVLTFFLADIQTGFGPFIAVYLTAAHWTAAQIGAALSVGSIVSIVAQVPAGAAIDAIPLKRLAALIALLSVMGSALLLAMWPSVVPVYLAEVLHGVASCMLVPAVAAISLSRVGRAALGNRLGRNTRFMALGAAIGAAAAGYAGAHLMASAPFWLTALSTVPALLALLALPPRHETMPRPPRLPPKVVVQETKGVLFTRRLVVLVAIVALFQTANGFLLTLAITHLTARVGENANLFLAACLVLPQGIVALISPTVGRLADTWGRRRVLLIGYMALPLRAVLLGVFGNPYLVIAAQSLDGVGGAMFGVMQPLLAADITQGTNRFNLVLGILGLAGGLGGTLSSAGGGWIATHVGYGAAFATLAAIGALAVFTVWKFMPETKPADQAA